MSNLNLILLGPPRIERDGVTIKLDTKKTFALFTYLTLTRQTHRRDSLVDLLWPHSDQTNGRALLRGCLHNINKVLGDGTLESDRETVTLDPNVDLWVDVNEFRNFLAKCKTHGHPSDDVCPSCLKPLKDAVGLYHGDFLSGFSLKDSVLFDDWQSAQSQSLRSDLDVGLKRLIRCLGEEGELEKAIDYARRWLELEATNEEAHRQLMELYARSGQRNTALRQYEDYVKALKEMKDDSPQEETVRLYQEIKGDTFSAEKTFSKKMKVEVEELHSQKAHQVLRHNLPHQLTSFIGREREMREIKALLSKTYLLTLTGAGGSGKTRLGLQLAADLIEQYEDGVWVVELAPLSDPELVPQEVASALDVHEVPGSPIVGTLLNYLRSKELLLIIDNCEHLIEASVTLSDTLLHACPNLKILATSREGLGIAGELTYRVPSLSLPDPEYLPSLGNLGEYEAVNLFVERALFSRPSFAVTDRNAQALVQICQRLDGIPLAIELAAARVKALLVDQILERLDDNFSLLTGGSRTALPRQQTLRATMDWSYNLLKQSEKLLLSRLSVFAGGWTLQAAEGVGGGQGIEEDEVLDLLTGLVDKSLVMTEEVDGKGRYRLLETARQYSRDKLLEFGGAASLRTRHLEWYLGLAENVDAELFRGKDQLVWLDRLEVEHDNFRAALEWSQRVGDERGSMSDPQESPDSPESPDSRSPSVELGLRLAGALGGFWIIRNYYNEGYQWLEGALSRSNRAPVSALTMPARAKAIFRSGWILSLKGDKERAVKLTDESLALYRELEDKGGVSQSLSQLGTISWRQGNYVQGRALLEESLSLFQEMEDKIAIALSYFRLGVLERHYGDYERAEALLDKSLEMNRKLVNKVGILFALLDLGHINYNQGNFIQAKEMGEEGLSLLREIGGDKRDISVFLRLLGLVALGQGDHVRASELLRKSMFLFHECGAKWEMVQMLEGLAGVSVAQGEWERGARLLGAAEFQREDISAPLPPCDRDDYERSVAAARSKLGEEAFAAEWPEGRRMTLEEAVEFALSE